MTLNDIYELVEKGKTCVFPTAQWGWFLDKADLSGKKFEWNIRVENGHVEIKKASLKDDV